MVILNTIRLPGETNHQKRPKLVFKNYSHQIGEAKVAVPTTVLHRRAEVQEGGVVKPSSLWFNYHFGI